MFEIYTKEVEINGQKYMLRPLSGRHIQKFYNVVSKLNIGGSSKESEDEAVNKLVDALASGAGEDLHYLALETLKKSYPQEDEEKLDEFVTKNLVNLVSAIVVVNMPDTAAD